MKDPASVSQLKRKPYRPSAILTSDVGQRVHNVAHHQETGLRRNHRPYLLSILTKL